MATNKLSVLAIEHAIPGDKPRKLTDGNGLYLLVHTSGAKYWRYDYRYQGKRKTLALGVFPEVSLKQARKDHLAARAALREGTDPNYKKQVAKLTRGFGESFEATALEWLGKQRRNWTPGHARTVEGRLKNDLLPRLGNRPIDLIEPVEVLAVLRAIEKRGANETAHRVRTVASQIFQYGVTTNRVKYDPCRDLAGALQPVTPKQLASISNPDRLGELLRAVERFTGSETVKTALAIAPHVFVRPGELRGARWEEIDFNRAMWTIPEERMKAKRKHHVPLSSQVLKLFETARGWQTGTELIFCSPTNKNKSISDVAMNGALRRIGFESSEITMHGFRHTASTLLNERRDFDADLIEAQLAHQVGSDIRRTYNKASWLEERKAMMQDWSDYLTSLAEAKEKSYDNR